MFGNLIGAFAGAEASKYTSAVGGTGGAVLGAIAVPLVRRLSIPALLVLGAGGYLAKRYMAKAEANSQARAQKSARKPRRPRATKTAAPAA